MNQAAHWPLLVAEQHQSGGTSDALRVHNYGDCSIREGTCPALVAASLTCGHCVRVCLNWFFFSFLLMLH